MKTTYAIILFSLLTLGGSLWYVGMAGGCYMPVYYSLGDIDARFGVSNEEVLEALAEAEAVWEKSLGQDIFEYKTDASLQVNFIYDERQQSAVEAEKFKDILDSRESATESISDTYNQLVAKYEAMEVSFENQKNSYEAKLAAYNAEVQKYNSEGGAPAEVFRRLERTKDELNTEQQALNNLADKLNDLSVQINELGDKGNDLIKQYNDSVGRYNDAYGSEEEFTQGDYTGSSIDVYTFTTHTELVTVLAHELGHALGLDHVDNEASIMYYLIGEQGSNPAPSAEDKSEFFVVCENKSEVEKIEAKVFVWINEHRPF